LHGEDPLAEPLLGWFPADGGSAHPTGADDIEAMVSFVVARGAHTDTVGDGTIRVEDGDGVELALDIHQYYGHGSHVVNLRPVDGWTVGQEYAVTVGPGLATWDGLDYDAFGFSFTTTASDDPPAEPTCACSAEPMIGPRVAAWLLAPIALAALRRRTR
jgi:hypothetical protein